MFPVRSHPLPRLAPLAAALALAASGTSIAASHAHDAYAMRLAQRQFHATGAMPSNVTRPVARRATLPVTSCADDADPGTLRNVLAVAQEGDTVDLSALTCSKITLTQGELDTSVLGNNHLYDITVQGPGRDALTIDANDQSQVFVVGGYSSDQGTFTLSDVTVANGRYTGSLAACILGFGGAVELNRVTVTNCHSSGTQQLVFGGAVDVNTLRMTDSSIIGSSLTATGANGTGVGGGAYSLDDAVLVRSTISGNSVVAPWAYNPNGYISAGGGLYVGGKLTLEESTVSGNSISATKEDEDANGGGIYVRGVTRISQSTIDGNHADGNGGGVYKAVFSIFGDPPPPQDTRIEIVDSTVSGNMAKNGGGVASTRPLSIANSTVVFNEASAIGGGVWLQANGITGAAVSLALQSAILAHNDGGSGDLGADSSVTITGANNLVMAADAALALPPDTLAADPKLFPLNYNGGPTRTHALAADSVAIDAGNNAANLAFDQRGANFARVSGAAADIGAFEAQRPGDDDTIFKDGFDGAVPTAPVEYAYDDGDATADGGNIGPPSSFSPDMLWGNYYPVQPGGEFITKISVAFGPTFPSLSPANPVTFWLLQDDDADGDPANAHAVASVQGVPDVFNDSFFSVDIPPTWVHGAIFVGASAKLAGGQDRPARIDGAGPQETSWFFYAPDIPTVINDLASAPYGVRMDVAPVTRRGTFMVRAHGQASP